MFRSRTSSDRLSPPLKWHGGKWYLAPRIWDLIRARGHRHTNYVEPYLGGGSMLLARPDDIAGACEVVNDLHKDLTNFWRVLQGTDTFASFTRLCQATPFSEIEWHEAALDLEEWPNPVPEVSSAVVRAWRFFVVCRMSLAGRMKSFTGITTTRTRRGMSNEVSAWLTAVDGLPAVHARLQSVMILNRPAVDVMRKFDSPTTLYYLDPPYMHDTRATTGDYRHEMTENDHRDMLRVCAGLTGKVVLSGYDCYLYRDMLQGAGGRGVPWTTMTWDMPNHAAGGKDKRRMQEVVWLNF